MYSFCVGGKGYSLSILFPQGINSDLAIINWPQHPKVCKMALVLSHSLISVLQYGFFSSVFHSAEKIIETNFLSLFKLIFSSSVWLKVAPRSWLPKERRKDIWKLMTSLSSRKVTEKQSCLHKNGHFKGRKTLSSNKNRDTSVLYFFFWMYSPHQFQQRRENFQVCLSPLQQDFKWQCVEILTKRKQHRGDLKNG